MKTFTYLYFCMLLCMPIYSMGSNVTNTPTTSSNPIQRVRIDVITTMGYTRHLLLGFTSNNTATDGFDYGYDALNQDTYPNDSSWVIDGQAYVIQGVGAFNETKAYPIGLFLSDAGTVEFQLQALENFETDIDVFIYDAETEVVKSINDTGFLELLEAGDYLSRFYITFTDDIDMMSFPDQQLSVDAPIQSKPKINYISSTQQLQIETTSSFDIETVKLYSILGQKVKQWSNLQPNANGHWRVSLANMSKGTYLVSVKTKTGEYKKRLIIGK